MESIEFETIAERLGAEPAEQLDRKRCSFVVHINHSTEAARVVEPQRPERRRQVEVIVRAGRLRHIGEPQAAGHAEVQQQHAFAQIDQQVLAASPHRAHRAADQRRRLDRERPPQRLAHAHRLDPGARDALGKTQAGDFDFGEFGHGGRRTPETRRNLDPAHWSHKNLGLLWLQ